MSFLETDGEIRRDIHYIMRVYISNKIVKGRSKQSVFIIPYRLLHFEKEEGVLYRNTTPLTENEVKKKFRNIEYKVINNMVYIPIYTWNEEHDSSKDILQAMKEKDLVIKHLHSTYNTSEVKRNANESMKGFWIKHLSSGNLEEFEEIIEKVIVRTKLAA